MSDAYELLIKNIHNKLDTLPGTLTIAGVMAGGVLFMLIAVLFIPRLV